MATRPQPPHTPSLQALLLERLQNGAALVFGVIARSGASDAVAYTPEVPLQDLLDTEERKWHAAKLPVYLADDPEDPEDTGVHVADIILTIAAQRALRQICKAQARRMR